MRITPIDMILIAIVFGALFFITGALIYLFTKSSIGYWVMFASLFGAFTEALNETHKWYDERKKKKLVSSS